MLNNISRLFFVVFSMFIVLLISNSIYAETTATPLKMMCARDSVTPTKYKHYLDSKTQAKTQLSLSFNGIKADDYPKGIIKTTMDVDNNDVLDGLSEEELDVLCDIEIHVVAKCIGSGKEMDMDAVNTLNCDKGDHLEITLFAPTCSGKGNLKKGLFTIYETRDDEKKDSVFVVNKNSTKTYVPKKVKNKKFHGIFGGFGKSFKK